ncbi:MAG: hypothetical protein KAT65_23525 [Methanophagales archaeon]|nr:hypothetical protein [Methanophagales archaeon]
MIGKFQLKGGISEPSSDITPNWRDMRSEFGYKLLYEIVPLMNMPLIVAEMEVYYGFAKNVCWF